MYSTAFFLRHVLWLCFCLWDVGPAPGISHSHRARSHATKPCHVRTAPGDTTSSRARTLIGRLGRAVVDRVSERRVAFAVRRSEFRSPVYNTMSPPHTQAGGFGVRREFRAFGPRRAHLRRQLGQHRDAVLHHGKSVHPVSGLALATRPHLRPTLDRP